MKTALNLELLAQSGIKTTSLKIVGGGAKSRTWNQMKADIYGIPCTTIKGEEGRSYRLRYACRGGNQQV